MVGVLLLAVASKADGASRVVAGEGAVETPRWRLAAGEAESATEEEAAECRKKGGSGGGGG
jgi:hypothetical protein